MDETESQGLQDAAGLEETEPPLNLDDFIGEITQAFIGDFTSVVNGNDVPQGEQAAATLNTIDEDSSRIGSYESGFKPDELGDVDDDTCNLGDLGCKVSLASRDTLTFPTTDQTEGIVADSENAMVSQPLNDQPIDSVPMDSQPMRVFSIATGISEIRTVSLMPLNDAELFDLVSAFKCRLCGSLFELRENFLQHVETNHPLTEVLTMAGGAVGNRDGHGGSRPSKQNANEVIIFSCGFCELEFSTQVSCLDHIEIVHPDQRLKPKKRTQGRNIALPVQSENSLLVGHRRTLKMSTDAGISKAGTQDTKIKRVVHPPRRLEKDYWVEKMREKPVLLPMQPSKTLLCDVLSCRYKFSSELNRSVHKNCHNVMEGDGGDTSRFLCYLCSLGYDKWSRCQLHLWNMHQVDVDLFACGVCQIYKTVTAQRLLVHQQTHTGTKEHMCHICDKQFSQAAQLTNHQVTHIMDQEDLPTWAQKSFCTECQQWLADAPALRRHRQATHESGHMLSCHHCAYTTSRKGDLNLHVRTHTNDRPYLCELCEANFNDHNALRRHRSVHLPRTTLRCPHENCEYTCAWVSAFKHHIVKNHGNDGGIMFKCHHCETFSTDNCDHFLKHYRGQHERQLVTDAINNRLCHVTLQHGTSQEMPGNFDTAKGISEMETLEESIVTELSDGKLTNISALSDQFPSPVLIVIRSSMIVGKDKLKNQISSDVDDQNIATECTVAKVSEDRVIIRFEAKQSSQSRDCVYDAGMELWESSKWQKMDLNSVESEVKSECVLDIGSEALPLNPSNILDIFLVQKSDTENV